MAARASRRNGRLGARSLIRIRCLGCGQRIPAGTRKSRCPRCLKRRDGKYNGAWRDLRLQILKRDHYRCQIQGPRCTGRATEVDHIRPGGGDHASNLQAACKPCNSGKRDRG